MCQGDKKCAKCAANKMHKFASNFSGTVTYKKFEGREHLVVPVVMAKYSVVMNGGLIPEGEFIPESWDGVPVTIGHPQENESFVTANRPDILEQWCVGRIFNAQVKGDALVGEAWIDVDKAERVYPGLVARIVKSSTMDVSTGYFCEEEDVAGEANGQKYDHVQHHLLPNHLALLPDEEGACNWNSGCGVRTHKAKRGMQVNVKDTLALILRHLNLNAGGDAPPPAKKDVPTMCEDLISGDSPFAESDRAALMTMSEAALSAVHSSFCQPAAQVDDPVETPAEEKGGTAVNKKTPVLNSEERAALDFAMKAHADHRNSLVARITSNSSMKAEALTSMSVAQLEVIANGLTPAPTPNYDGRPAIVHANSADDSVAADMGTTGVIAHIRNRKKERA